MPHSSDLVLVTGLSGFIAKHVAKRLLDAGHRVRGTVRSPEKGDAARQTLSRHGADISRLEIVQANLLADAGWDAAVRDCRYVQHTASPFPGRPPRDKFGLVPAAKGGTLRVVDAARRAGVERLVLTSSVVAVYHGHEGRTEKRYTEADVSNVESASISSYAVSKTLAERAAWDAVSDHRMELAVLNPALVLGPTLGADAGTSLSIVAAMMRGLMPIVPKARFGIVDVRDVAEAHYRAMLSPQAAGSRFILSADQRTLVDIGATLKAAYPALPRLPRSEMPDWTVRLAAKLSSRAALLQNELDPERSLDNSPARQVLKLDFRTPEVAIESAARSLVEVGLVRA